MLTKLQRCVTRIQEIGWEYFVTLERYDMSNLLTINSSTKRAFLFSSFPDSFKILIRLRRFDEATRGGFRLSWFIKGSIRNCLATGAFSPLATVFHRPEIRSSIVGPVIRNMLSSLSLYLDPSPFSPRWLEDSEPFPLRGKKFERELFLKRKRYFVFLSFLELGQSIDRYRFARREKRKIMLISFCSLWLVSSTFRGEPLYQRRRSWEP